MKNAVYLFFLFILLSCNNTNIQNENEKFETIVFEKYKNKISNIIFQIQTKDRTKSIKDYISADNSKYYRWNSHYYEPSIVFYEEYALYWFNGQCVYYFFTYPYDDCIKLIWSYKVDCITNMDFLEKSHGVKNFPKNRDIFAEYSLLNDTTLKVKYYFPEWKDRVNLIEKDTIFPDYFYLMK